MEMNAQGLLVTNKLESNSKLDETGYMSNCLQ